MLRVSISFFVIGLLAYILGAYNIAGLSIDIGKIILIVFVILAILSFLMTLITGKKTNL